MMDFSVVNENEVVRDGTSPAVIKVIGCGGGGSNAVNRMIDAKIPNVEFVVLNTDLQALNLSKAPIKIQIGKKLAHGLGAGGNPKVGEESAKEDEAELAKLLEHTDMVFITAGMGGGTGTGSAPVLARIARGLGVLTVGVVTTPFEFEGQVRMRHAREGIEKLRENVDSLIIIPNEQLAKVIDKNMPIREAFLVADDVLKQGIEGISNIITKPGDVNRDFTDVKNAMMGQGDAILGVGVASGENRAVDAATKAIKNPLLEDTDINGARNILVNICSAGDITTSEVSEIMHIVTDSAYEDANVLWGQVVDPSLEKKVSVTVIAAGFNKAEAEFSPNLDVAESAPHDLSVVSSDEFSDILSGKDMEDFEEKVPVGVDARAGGFVKHGVSGGEFVARKPSLQTSRPQVPLGKALQATPAYYQNGVSPVKYVQREDLSRPACWANDRLSGLPRGIKLHD